MVMDSIKFPEKPVLNIELKAAYVDDSIIFSQAKQLPRIDSTHLT